jgi:DNA-binding CsgD family transcriptional regulator
MHPGGSVSAAPRERGSSPGHHDPKQHYAADLHERVADKSKAVAANDRLPATAKQTKTCELVGALSLGIDLGFGQPMEHVLRQCLIALRLGERLGLDDEQRAVVYYVALLISVDCHSDAHEQAKWFGDDIELKSRRYDHEFRSVRAAASTVRMLGAGNSPLHRFRIGLELALAGHRDVDDMIAQHARLARRSSRAAAARGPGRADPTKIEVLRQLVRGLSNKEIAQRLVISPKTDGNHVEHIYAKIYATNRAGASLFAPARTLARGGPCRLLKGFHAPHSGPGVVGERRSDADGGSALPRVRAS